MYSQNSNQIVYCHYKGCFKRMGYDAPSKLLNGDIYCEKHFEAVKKELIEERARRIAEREAELEAEILLEQAEKDKKEAEENRIKVLENRVKELENIILSLQTKFKEKEIKDETIAQVEVSPNIKPIKI